MNDVSHISSMYELQNFIRVHNIRVVRKSSKFMLGFVGMSDEDGRWGVNIPKNTIFIDQNLRGRELFRTLKHEVEEMLLIRGGMKYFPAHRIATRDEVKR